LPRDNGMQADPPMDSSSRPRLEPRRLVSQLVLDPHFWVLALVPLFVLFVSSNWIFSPMGYIDPWVYHGFFLHLQEFKTVLFAGTYYGSRLSWILPGYVFYKFLPPLAANYALHLALLYAAIFGLYYALKIGVNRQAALVTSVFLGSFTFFLWPVGSDYVDGPANTYFFVCLAFLTAAARNERNRLTLFLAGVFYAAMVYANLFTVIFAAVVALYFAVLSYRSKGRLPLGSVLWSLLWFLSGAAALTVALGCANFLIEGTFLFYLPSIFYAMASAGHPNPWKAPVAQWISHAEWLLLPLVVVVAGLVALSRRWFRASVAGPAAIYAFLLACCLMLLCEGKGIPVLQYNFYASYLFPTAFLAIGALLEKPLQHLKGPSTILLALGVLLVNTVPLWGYNGYLARLKIGFWPAAPLLFGVVFVACGALNVRGANWSIVAALVACNLTTVSIGYSVADRHEARHEFARVSEAVATVDAVRRGEPVRFWYSVKDPHFPEFNALNSIYLWGYTMIGNEFPTIMPTAVVTPGALVVILSSSGDVLPQANESLREKSFVADLVDRRDVTGGGAAYTLWFVRVGFDFTMLNPQSLHSCEAAECNVLADAASTPSELPSGGWIRYQDPNLPSSLERGPEGLAVSTAPTRSAFAVKYGPLVANDAGRYVFRLRYRLLSGGMTFGALAKDESRWLAYATAGASQPGERTAVLSLEAAPGEPFWLMIANDHPRGDYASHYTILGLEAYRFPAENPAAQPAP
jgi:hypothetical protein